MEEEINGEQPEMLETLQEEKNMGSPEVSEEENVEQSKLSEAERGVPIGKFKSVEDLYNAYNNLQSEFTRKCQRLSELEKDKTVPTTEEKLDADFKQFLLDNQEAFAYADEIKARVMQDESLKNQQQPFEKVWAGMVLGKLNAKDRAQEPLIQNLVLKDEELKNLVIENYMKQLQEHKTPFIMSSGSGERVTKAVAPKPDSFEQAKQVVLDLLS